MKYSDCPITGRPISRNIRKSEEIVSGNQMVASYQMSGFIDARLSNGPQLDCFIKKRVTHKIYL
jgi:hypothetical protein